MEAPKQLSRALLALRLGVFIVFAIWVADKFLNPDHTSKVFQHFYFSPAFGPSVSYVIGTVQLIILIGFVLGIKKRLTYGLIFLLHSVSTLSSYKIYMSPWDIPNILFWAAWPMLAACYALYILRDYDTLWTLGKK